MFSGAASAPECPHWGSIKASLSKYFRSPPAGGSSDSCLLGHPNGSCTCGGGGEGRGLLRPGADGALRWWLGVEDVCVGHQQLPDRLCATKVFSVEPLPDESQIISLLREMCCSNCGSRPKQRSGDFLEGRGTESVFCLN